jgi:hypothetical protein
MSERIEHRGPNGELLGTERHFSPRRPTRQSSGQNLTPTAADGSLRLAVRCRGRQLLGVYGTEPPTLLGRFAAPRMKLRGVEVIVPRPDRLWMWLGAGRDRAEFAEQVAADTARPLQLWCPSHKQGHDVDPALLRAEIAKADRANVGDPWCPVGRVEATGS